MPTLQQVVSARIAEINLGPIEAATKGGLERTFIKDIVDRRKTSIRQSSMAALARALHWTPSELAAALQGDRSPPQEIRPAEGQLVPVRHAGRVAAGQFREVDEFEEVETVDLYEPRDRLFPNARLMSFEADGDSMNDLKPDPIRPGARVVCVSFDDLQGTVILRDGMVVVVERVLAGGHMRERSVKQIEIHDDHLEFHPRSTNPRHRPIVVKKDLHADDGTTVAILAIVRRISNDVPL